MDEKEGVKPGIKTTEFWLTLAAVLIGALVASGLLLDLGETWHKLAGVALSVLAALGYTAGRSAVKKSAQSIFPVLLVAVALSACAATWDGKARQTISGLSLAGVKARQTLNIVCSKPLRDCKAAGKVYAECPKLHECQDKRSEGYKALIVVQRSLLLASEGVRLGKEPSVAAALQTALKAMEQVRAVLALYGVTL